jgi:hypothetical protein
LNTSGDHRKTSATTTAVTRSVAIFATACGLGACGGSVPQQALDARAAQHRACEQKPNAERVECVEHMALLRDDEPRDGECAFRVSGQEWKRKPNHECLSRLDLHPCAASTLGTSARSATSADAIERLRFAKSECDARLNEIDRAAECLRTWTSTGAQEEVAPGRMVTMGLVPASASLSCFVGLEHERGDTLAQTVELTKALAASEKAKAVADDQAARTVAETARSEAAERILRDAPEECRKGLLENTSRCDDPNLTDAQRKVCATRCRDAGHEEADRTFATGVQACVETFAETASYKDGCPVRRPPTGFLAAGDEFDKRMSACVVECKKRGPAARTQALADKAREARAEADRRREAARSPGSASTSSSSPKSTGTQGATCCAKCGGSYVAGFDACQGDSSAVCFMCCMGQIPASAPSCNGWR